MRNTDAQETFEIFGTTNPDGSITETVRRTHECSGSTLMAHHLHSNVKTVETTQNAKATFFGTLVHQNVQSLETDTNVIMPRIPFLGDRAIVQVSQTTASHEMISLDNGAEEIPLAINIVPPETKQSQMVLSVDRGVERKTDPGAAIRNDTSQGFWVGAAVGVAVVAATLVANHRPPAERKAAAAPTPAPLVLQQADDIPVLSPAFAATSQQIKQQIANGEFKGITVIAGGKSRNVEKELGTAIDKGDWRLTVARIDDAAFARFNGPGHNTETRKDGAALYGEAGMIAAERDMSNPNAERAKRNAQWLLDTKYARYVQDYNN